MIREQLLSTDETALNVAIAGDGPPLVLLHGVTRAWQDYGELFGSLAARWRVIALDFRGHGRSKAAPGRYRVVDYVRDAVAVLRAVVDRPAVIVGHSLGAMVAAAAAAEMPQLARGVALLDPPFDTMGSRIESSGLLGYFQQLQRLALKRLSVADAAREMAEISARRSAASKPERLGNLRDAAAIRFCARCLAAADPEILAPIVAGDWLRGYERTAIFKAIRSPALLLQGSAALGGMLTDDDAREFRELVADCSFVRIDGAGHLLHWQQAQLVTRLIMAFVDSLDDPHDSTGATTS